MTWKESLKQIDCLRSKGFPSDKIVIRVDPIIPTKDGIAVAEQVIHAAYKTGMRRFRISVIDMYPHARERFVKAGISLPYGNYFTASDTQFKVVDECIKRLKETYSNISIECCAEPKLQQPQKTGCISNHDLILLGLPAENSADSGYQRNHCLCLNCKAELLNNKHQCPNKCLYCYWKD